MKFLNKVKKYSLIAIAICAVFGLLFLLFPAQSIKYISLAVGIALIVMGAVGIVGYITNKNGGFTLALGIISAIIGIIICIKYQAIISIIVVLLGIFILGTGVFNLFTGIKVVVASFFTGWITFVLSIAEIVFGIIAITKSNDLSEGIVQFIGVALILYAVIDLVAYFQVKKAFKDSKQRIDSNGDIEVDGVEVKNDDE